MEGGGAGSRTLRLQDRRIQLNSCGVREVRLSVVDEVIEVREWDGPDGAGGRCWCTGVFDFVIDLACLPPGVVRLRLVREVVETGTITLFDGQLDLAEGQGSKVLDDSPAPWCQVG